MGKTGGVTSTIHWYVIFVMDRVEWINHTFVEAFWIPVVLKLDTLHFIFNKIDPLAYIIAMIFFPKIAFIIWSENVNDKNFWEPILYLIIRPFPGGECAPPALKF